MDDRAHAMSLTAVTPEIARRLNIYIDLLGQWRSVTNLISESSFAQVWMRHVADSAQLLAYAPSARRWLDFGSGAGFPGIVIAIQLAGRPGAVVHCIESDRRKSAFLRRVVRATGAPVFVHSARIESIDPKFMGPVDAVTARGLGPLPQVIELANVWIGDGALGIFPCGRSASEQVRALTEASKFEIETFPSRLDADARIVRVRSATQAQQ